MDDHVGPQLGEEAAGVGLIGEVEVGAADGGDLGPLGGELAARPGAEEAPASGDDDAAAGPLVRGDGGHGRWLRKWSAYQRAVRARPAVRSTAGV